MILSIETSTQVCSVALHRQGQLIALNETLIEKSHAGVLTVLIEQTLKNVKAEMTDLSAVAVGKGPGSFTGLRIGTTAAKGLCFALDIPLIAVNTLQAMAFGVNEGNFSENTVVCPMIDARRSEVYCAIYDQNNNCLQPTEAAIIDNNSFSELLKEKQIIFFGDGAAKCKPLLGHSPNAVFIDNAYPSAKNVGILSVEFFNENNFEDLDSFEPYYLKEFIPGQVRKP